MNAAKGAKAPYLSLRYARIGRLGERGQLPHGWNGEHLAGIEVVDVNSPGEPWLMLDLWFDEGIPGDYAGLCVGAYLPVAKGSIVTLAGEVYLAAHENIETAFLLVREWEPGGGLVGQSARPLAIGEGLRTVMVSHAVVGDERLAQPLFMFKRRSLAPGHISLTLKGLAFGDAADHPDWLRTHLEG